MLNERLHREVAAIGDQGRSGKLTVVFGETTRQLYFQNGQLLLLDLCEDKEVLLAREYLIFNKIEVPLHNYAVEAYQKSGVKVSTTLRQQQLVSEDEEGQVVRAMVEDVLCDLFSGETEEMRWEELSEESLEEFELTDSILKLRIETPVLLETIRARVQLRDIATGEVQPDDVFVFAEGGTDVSQLNEMERHVLQMVDGHKTVEQIAKSMRDSVVNASCFLKSLMDHGCIRKGSLSSVRPGIPSVPVASGEGSDIGSASQLEDFDVYTSVQSRSERIERRRSPLVPILLGVIVLAVIGLGILVVVHIGRQQVVSTLQEQLLQVEADGDFHAGAAHIAAALETARDDVELTQAVEETVADFRKRLRARLDQLEKALQSGNIEAAESQVVVLPDESEAELAVIWSAAMVARSEDLRVLLEEERSVAAGRNRDMVQSLRLMLKSNQVDKALAFIASKEDDSAIADQLRRALRAWQKEALEDLERGDVTPAERARVIAALEQTELPPGDAAELQRHRAILDQQLDRLATIMKQARHLKKEGELRQAASRLRSIGEQIVGTIHEQDFEELRSGIEQSLDQQQQTLDRLGGRLVDGGLDALSSEEVDQLESSDYDELVDALRTAAKAGTVLDERDHLARWVEAHSDTPGSDIAERRVAVIDRRQRELGQALIGARQLAADGDFAAAVTSFSGILGREDWKAFPAYTEAKDDLAHARKRVGQQAGLGEELRAAMRKGQAAEVGTIAARLGITVLPIYVTSRPTGATVHVDGEEVGPTPLFIEGLSLSDRLQTDITLRMSGFQDRQVSAVDAVGGWQLQVSLERDASVTADLEEAVTSQPAVIEGHLWVAGNREVFQVRPDGSHAIWPLGSGTVATVRAVERAIEAPVLAGPDAHYVTTRDGFVVRLQDGDGTRHAIPAASDRAVLPYISPVLLDTTLLILSHDDGGLSATAMENGERYWHHPSIPPAAGPLVLKGDDVLLVDQRGGCWSIAADGGEISERRRLGEPVLAAWRHPEGLTGLTATQRWHWDGEDLRRQPLGERITDGGAGVVITEDRRVLMQDDGEWRQATLISERVSAEPLLWNDHAVLVFGKRLRVIGPQGFQVEADAELLQPVQLGERLAVVSRSGEVRLYDPVE